MNMLRIYCGIALVAWSSSVSTAQAQYHLTELGAVGGLGLALGYQYSSNARQETGLALPAAGYLSHWVCGKSWGYQVDAGFNYAGQRYSISVDKNGTDPDQIPPSAGLRALWFHTGFSFKLRAKNYHRPRELCFVFGPVMQTRLWSQAVLQRDPYSSASRLPGRGNAFRFGAQASLWFRLPMGKRLSWFLVPGFEFLTPYQMRTSRYPNAYIIEFWQPMLRVGFTLWNNR